MDGNIDVGRVRIQTLTDHQARLDKALKVFANAASYGIYAEMNVQESDEPVTVRCHGLDAEPFTCRVATR